MLDKITPVILTYNEATNIDRVLKRLQWARDIVIVDSFSKDNTIQKLSNYSNVRFFQRKFDTHANQWNYALHQTGVSTEWVLALDADYVLTQELVEELKTLSPPAENSLQAGFIYCINGLPLKRSLYPPKKILFRRESANYRQDGHTQRLSVSGGTKLLFNKILHDDRKPLTHWITTQNNYMQLEADKLRTSPWSSLSWADRLRLGRLFAPFLMFFYCFFIKGGILNGLPGLYYTLQRVFAELMLSMYLLQNDMNPDNNPNIEV